MNITVAGQPLIKFQNKDIIESTQKGLIYMNSMKIYRDLYEESGDENIGDPNEGRLYFNNGQIVIDNCSQNFNHTIMPTTTEDDFVYCMFGIKDVPFIFSEEHYKLWKNQYDTALIIKDTYELKKRIVLAAQKQGADIQGGFVKYYSPDKNEIEPLLISLVSGKEVTTAFYKRDCYSYQKEYRLRVENPKHLDHFELQIGDIHDISIAMPVERIMNSKVEKTNLEKICR